MLRMTVHVSAESYEPISFPIEFTANDCGAIGSQRWSVFLNESGNESGRAELAETTEPCR
ncbi:MAG: hypothetical protein DRJ42_29835 [Deltaproteobacteria bacterium]|nr:MAG: hypothetical protein DRJ42_29835 [Deltaproteobacteria bacterium]